MLIILGFFSYCFITALLLWSETILGENKLLKWLWILFSLTPLIGIIMSVIIYIRLIIAVKTFIYSLDKQII